MTESNLNQQHPGPSQPQDEATRIVRDENHRLFKSNLELTERNAKLECAWATVAQQLNLSAIATATEVCKAVNSIREEVDVYKNEYNRMAEKYEELRQRQKSETSRDYEATLNKLRQRLGLEQNAGVLDILTEIRNLQNQLAKVEEQRVDASLSLQKSREERNRLNEELNRLKGECKNEAQERKRLENELDQVKQQLDMAVQERDTAARQREAAQSFLRSIQDKRNKAIEDRDQARSERDQAKQEREEIGQKRDQLQKDLVEARNKISETRSERDQAKQELNEVRSERDYLRNVREELRDQRDDAYQRCQKFAKRCRRFAKLLLKMERDFKPFPHWRATFLTDEDLNYISLVDKDIIKEDGGNRNDD